MPSVRYINQTAPFWDFLANLEEQGANHPFFAGINNINNNRRGEESDNEQRPNPWTEGGWGGFPFSGPFGGFPHRGRWSPPQHPHGPPHHEHHGPPPPPDADRDMAPDPPEKAPEHDPEEGPSDPRGPPPPFSEESHHGPGPHRGPRSHHGRCGGRGRGGWGGRGRHGPFGGHGGFGGPGGLGALAGMFQSQLFGDNATTDNAKEESKEDNFKPEVDVFDTPESFVVHISLPGAKKEDVGVNWDPEKSELNIAGVIYRPGDEELLKTLALDERKVGAFERKIRLGSRANPAQVDVDAISARMEDGILRIDVPKLDSDYVEVKKVDIQ